ncbi:type IX secretion system membrane protein PorP/SprF [Cytophagales bacterium LB-30]|uniref:Type IX secretion system membrane protein PorP/SprF n=1 Tax=Shiella aurantiaca TaxID=3058365 RepID=A0ABT8F9N4_9BACT|nr:type IX secretion system membrane protein PorP/SprF [Shiella aurantiaca]MDN4166959.1 type IX secretion system membrane protein PorP/SprF [Shiella aurantiaca]
MLNRYFFGLWATLLLTALSVRAQDPQFSQFYASPLYLNPAFAGSTQEARAGLNYRNQWPAMEANFVSYSAYFDYMFQDYNSGLGFMVMSDQASRSGLRSNTLSAQYAYQIRISKTLAFRPGAQFSYTFRDANFDQFYFNSQWNPTTGSFDGAPPVNDVSGLGARFMGLGLGGLLYSKLFWIGYAAHHLNTPNQSFTGDSDPLSIKHSIHGGYKVLLEPKRTKGGYREATRERSFTPTFQYKMQGDFDQLDVGSYLTLEPLVLGIWYRGLPFKPYEGLRNNEAIILLIGYTYQGLNMGYSYDYTISNLGIASGGAHEISLSYQFPLRDPRKPPRDKMSVPCPKF